jgi:hypothetical protein
LELFLVSLLALEGLDCLRALAISTLKVIVAEFRTDQSLATWRAVSGREEGRGGGGREREVQGERRGAGRGREAYISLQYEDEGILGKRRNVLHDMFVP